MRESTTRRAIATTLPGQPHQSVLLQEVIHTLDPVPGGVYVDATFGDGGHSQAILQRIAPDGKLFAMDRDQSAWQRNQAILEQWQAQLTPIHTPFSRLRSVLNDYGIASIQGIIFDLGVSSPQLDDATRGFSFQNDGPLDMRMDQLSDQSPLPRNQPTPNGDPRAVTAATIVNTYDKEQLADIFFHYGEERHARRIAQAIVSDRQKQPFTTTRQLASLLERLQPNRAGQIHPATRVFQALRIAVNQELQELQSALQDALSLLAAGGRAVVISFHSLEDRIVKQSFRQAADPEYGLSLNRCGAELLRQPQKIPSTYRLLTRKPLLPSAAEIANNPRARSARMRAIERLAEPIAHSRPLPSGSQQTHPFSAHEALS
ncbi:16S rRNA (cytosine(1402)-N(4))-methyltransferase RsmH [Candidatus Magnetaquicoccus inordinatus]|uniref:16S rRNA (cytosine(1402)-N(4))-methyltransferase RsmH n=1 Tax=Candidatus Magnetaquicoccus inordinatus TaxID=2496818 RepID=UPI00102B5618|nr:16S rRNA (cytosine(1402)-N(4))-methyltransferase RsmH [Candidatus Magnetaquicoccus inordinatus]